ncbi:hypothetical protein A3752_08430 [Oleiphilus sp. HI0081]|uniref:hypothetical protein n=1 Tax=unclassified Oleiphilus TaxID=2631174 RepID=UPI0007C38C0F|nr:MULTISPECIES: hypothetical protein [unclassified Oleiphilus]KZY59135.1 hypothetical protein A3735_16010 [Oleiphilus sp. HI0061]KZY84943.1 hypothetical protein A3743_20255 [Oleiphilus sp. HI0072]KZZ21649.1 hypothetical protein A3752_08430 [Oleiphilus sp. HI0081]KZZ72121.1 hypothetical protein A3766_07395 [Oleiphilus sp. HI0132]
MSGIQDLISDKKWRQTGLRKAPLALVLLSCFTFSVSAQAESFKAKVKLTLVDPASVSAIGSTQQTLSMPVKKLDNSQCTIDPKSGSLQGNACLEPSVDTPQLDISGRAAQAISVKLSDSVTNSESAASLSFEPTLYNGYDQTENFQLSTSSHSVNIGGTIYQHNTSNSALNTQAVLQYGVEVLYP